MSPWTWVRPADPKVLSGRPLLDLGCGDGQTLAAIVGEGNLVVGFDRSWQALRAARRILTLPLVCGEAERLPFGDAIFRCVLAGDLLHHLDEAGLRTVLTEVRRVLADGGRLVAWWYAAPGRPAPDAPRFPRPYRDVAEAADGFSSVDPLPLDPQLPATVLTVGLIARA